MERQLAAARGLGPMGDAMPGEGGEGGIPTAGSKVNLYHTTTQIQRLTREQHGGNLMFYNSFVTLAGVMELQANCSLL